MSQGIDYYFKTGDDKPEVLYRVPGNYVENDSGNFTAQFSMRVVNPRGDAPIVDNSTATIEEYDNDNDETILSYELSQADTSNVGEYVAEFELTYPDGSVETFPKGEYIFIKISEAIA